MQVISCFNQGFASPYPRQLASRMVTNTHDGGVIGHPFSFAVLISHPDPAHLGALPYLVGKIGLSVPIYATGAVHKMGQMFMYNAYLTNYAAFDFTAFDLDDVDTAFSKITQLRFRQEVSLQGSGGGISITPLPAGHLIGGAVWKIVAGGEEFVYAVDFNHRRERHLNGSPLESTFLRPALLASDVGVVGRPHTDRDRAERALLDACVAALRADGNVLIPIDAAGRLLELILILENHWAQHKLPYPIALVGPMVHTTMEFARSQLEWMNEALVKSFGHSKDNPFTLRHIKLYASVSELRKLPPGPRVILAVDASLSVGPARHLFAEWAPDPRNTVIFPLSAVSGSLASTVISTAQERDRSHVPGSSLPLIYFSLSKRTPLKGEELERYLQEEKKRKEDGVAAMTMDGDEQTELAGMSPRSTSSSKSPFHPTRANVSAIGHASRDAAGLGAAGSGALPTELDGFLLETGLDAETLEPESVGTCLIEGFEVPEGAVAPMFPGEDEWEAVPWDEYGAAVDYAEFDTSGDGVGSRLGRALASEAEAERGGDGGDGAPADEAPEAKVPTKIESKEVSIPLAAKVVSIDFDGRSDGRSVQTLLSHIAPRTTVLVHASGDAIASLARRLETEMEGLQASVIAPAAEESINLPLGNSYQVNLANQLVQQIQLHSVGGYELAWVDGQVGPPGDGDVPEAQVDVSLSEPQLPTLGPKSDQSGMLAAMGADGDDKASTFGGVPSYGGVFIGDVRLSELRKALTAAGIRSEFRGGDLYCIGQVVVRRRGEGGLVVEGAMGDGYYKIRDIIYAQYHVC